MQCNSLNIEASLVNNILIAAPSRSYGGARPGRQEGGKVLFQVSLPLTILQAFYHCFLIILPYFKVAIN
jgi:hypothetical protein